MNPPRIAVFGIFGTTNLGNEATLAAFLANVRARFPDARLACIGPRDSEAQALYDVEMVDMEPVPVRKHFWPYFRFGLVRAAAAAAQLLTEPVRVRVAQQVIADFDLLIIPGTGILDDFGQGALDLPHHLLRWCRAARRAAVPIHFLSVGTEPVQATAIRAVLRRAAGLASSRSYRDEESRRNATDLGLMTAADEVYPDLAFSLPRTREHESHPISWPPRRVGLGVMGYHGWNERGDAGEAIYQEYLEKLKVFVGWLLKENYSVRLLVGDTRADARPVRDLMEAFSAPPIDGSGAMVVSEPIVTFHDLLREVDQTDLVVATRLHNVILSLLLGRPTISISYSSKTDVLLEEFSLASYRQAIESLDVDLLIDQFTRLSEGEDPTNLIRQKVGAYRLLLEHQYDRFFHPYSHKSPTRSEVVREDRRTECIQGT